MQIGCDPKHDSTRLLMHGQIIPTVLDYLKDTAKEQEDPKAVLCTGYRDIGCIEAGGPKPGVGCAGRGIISAFEFLDRHQIKKRYDTVVYDVLGDVVCGGFAVPVRHDYADAIFLVTSGEYMALYAANNILRGIRNFDGDTRRRVAGILYNERRIPDEDERVRRFAMAVGLPICARIPRSSAFSAAEEQKLTVMEMDEYPKEQAIFRQLAAWIREGLTLHEARPLSDSELESVVLGNVTLSQGDFAASPIHTGNETDHPGGPPESRSATGQDYGDGVLEERISGSRMPLYGCAFNGAATTAVHLMDALVIAHSPRACAFYTWQNISSPGRKNLFNRGILMPSAISPNFECTDMGQAEVVFGGMDQVRRKVTEALKGHPGAVVVISSCVSGIIGDDILDVESLSTPEIPVIAIPADGDIAGDYMEGIRMCMYTLARKLIDPAVKPSGRLVNLVYETGISNNHTLNYRIIRDLLEQLDIRINCRFLGDATAGQIKRFLAAPLNILADTGEDGIKLKEWLTANYGCRFLEGGFPVGFRATQQFVRQLGAHFHCEERAEEIINRERGVYQTRAEALKPMLSGKRILLLTVNTDLDWMMDAAYAVGMRFVWVGVLNYLHQPLHITAHPERCGEIQEEIDFTRIQEKIREFRPDIVLSNYTSEVDPGDYLVDAIPMTPMAGFHSALHIFERWEKLSGVHNGEGEWKDDQALFKKYCG